MKNLLKELGFEELPILSEFENQLNILYEETPFGDAKYRHWSTMFRKFITQPLIKGMFVPCSEDGEVLTKPVFPTKNRKAHDGLAELYEFKLKQYQQAKELIIFKATKEQVGAWEKQNLFDGLFTVEDLIIFLRGFNQKLEFV